MRGICTEDNKLLITEDGLYFLLYFPEIYSKIFAYNIPIQLEYGMNSTIKLSDDYSIPIELLKNVQSHIDFDKVYNSKIKPTIKIDRQI